MTRKSRDWRIERTPKKPGEVELDRHGRLIDCATGRVVRDAA